MKSAKVRGQRDLQARVSSCQGLAAIAMLLTCLVLGGCAGVVTGANSNTTAPPAGSVNITNVQAASVTTQSTQIAWTTDVPSSSSVDYGTSATYGSTTPTDSAMVTSHLVTVSGLSPATTYYFQVTSTDSKNNHGKSGGHNFKTNGLAISGAISPSAGGNGAMVVLGGASSATVTADSTGNYNFGGLPNGSYSVTASHSGYSMAPSSQSVTLNGTNVGSVNFTASAQAPQTFSITGTISPTAGGSGAVVTLGGASSASTVASSSGVYTFTGLANGAYTITPRNTGYTFAPASQTATVNGANVTGVNFTASIQTSPTFSVSGTISPAGAGSGATVTLGGPTSATTLADGSGNYAFTGLANGVYALTPSKAGYTFSPASLSATVNGANVSGLNFTGSGQTFSISGTISPTAGGSGATVTLSGAANATTTANASGVYTFSGLANGSYTLTPSKAGYTFNPASQTATINGANVTALNFTDVAVTFSISGTISPTAGGAGATVNLSGAATATTTANASGVYTFAGLPNGTYAITPTHAGYTFTPASQTATVNGANLTGINFTDTAQTFGISGTISPTTGGSGATVSLSGAANATTIANASGAYSFTGLLNGSYTITPSNTGFTFTPASQNATITGANVSGINFTAATAQSHSATASWTASTSAVSGYNVYRGTVNGGPYTKLNASLLSTVSFTDASVQNATTYYYVTTAVDAGGNESIFSNQAVAVVP